MVHSEWSDGCAPRVTDVGRWPASVTLAAPDGRDRHDDQFTPREVRVTPARPTGFRPPWPRRRIVAAALAATTFALAVGIPTGLVPTPLYTRMTPVLWWNYVAWAMTTVLGGLVVATYIRRPEDHAPRSGATAAAGGGLLTAFAVGCPICNKLVVAALGVSGAMTVWAPLQPVIAVLSIVGLAWALRRRLRNEYACSVSSDPRSRVASDDTSSTR